MVLTPGFPVGQHYKITMFAHCHKSVHILILPEMLLGRKTNKQGLTRQGNDLTGSGRSTE